MTGKVRKRLRALFIFLAVFALAQLVWWVYIMIDQQIQIAELLGTAKAHEDKKSFMFMILTEGTFWFIMWCGGLWAVYNTIRQERKLLMAHRDFLSGITHELKTPIANIQLCLEGLKRENLPEEKRLVFIDRALGATDKLHNEILNILSLNQQISLEPKSIATFIVKDLVEEAIEEIDDEKYKDIHWQISIPDKLDITTQREALKVVIKSILENAAKYTRAAVDLEDLELTPTVVVAYEEGQLYISDNGIGFNEKESENLFIEFHRGLLAKKLAIPGSGVGLSVAKQIANKLNIELKISSPGQYQGCSVRLKLQ